MALEDLIRDDYKSFSEAEEIVEALKNDETKYDVEPRAALGKIVHEDEPVYSRDYFLGSSLESAMPYAKKIRKKRIIKVIKDVEDRFGEALKLVPDKETMRLLYSVRPKSDSDRAKKHIKYMELVAALRDENGPQIEFLLQEIKDEEYRSLMSIDFKNNPQKVIDNFAQYAASIKAEFESTFKDKSGKVNYHEVKNYITENIENIKGNEKNGLYMAVAEQIARKK
ncbi:hypothetical protein J4466_01365 [Candidatus Pacearchaeota archaeon]|nr:hypothetical protein [Candidatus Pacearchaeota archaeon]